jgi:hypothetical protein
MSKLTKNKNNVICYLPCPENEIKPPSYETGPFEKVKYRKDMDVDLNEFINEIEIALNNEDESIDIFDVNSRNKPKYVSVKPVYELFQGNETDRMVEVEKYSIRKEARHVIPYCGFKVMGPYLFTAATTDDETAEKMINLCDFIDRNNLYKIRVTNQK